MRFNVEGGAEREEEPTRGGAVESTSERRWGDGEVIDFEARTWTLQQPGHQVSGDSSQPLTYI